MQIVVPTLFLSLAIIISQMCPNEGQLEKVFECPLGRWHSSILLSEAFSCSVYDEGMAAAKSPKMPNFHRACIGRKGPRAGKTWIFNWKTKIMFSTEILVLQDGFYRSQACTWISGIGMFGIFRFDLLHGRHKVPFIPVFSATSCSRKNRTFGIGKNNTVLSKNRELSSLLIGLRKLSWN